MVRPRWDYPPLDIVAIRHRVWLSLTTSHPLPVETVRRNPWPTLDWASTQGCPTRHLVSQPWNVFRGGPGIRFAPAPSTNPGRLPAGLDDVSTSEEHAAVTH